jgi:hypothetical protein
MIVASNAILDIKLQRGEMTDEEALRFIRRRASRKRPWRREAAAGEARLHHCASTSWASARSRRWSVT